MTRSMTGYGRASEMNDLGQFTIEITSINRKHLDVNVNLPRELLFLEGELIQWVGEKIGRGMIKIFISIRSVPTTPVAIVPNLALAREIQKACHKITTELGIDEYSNLLQSLLAQNPDILQEEQQISQYQDQYRLIFKRLLNESLERLIVMKQVEGQALATDLLSRGQFITKSLDKIDQGKSKAVEAFREKLKQRIEEIVPGTFENEERVLREVALFAERVDIQEEITRFRSHLDQFRTLLQSEIFPIGKQLDFLVVELNREINTILSKNSDTAISHEALAIKGEIERIREQVQNVE